MKLIVCLVSLLPLICASPVITPDAQPIAIPGPGGGPGAPPPNICTLSPELGFSGVYSKQHNSMQYRYQLLQAVVLFYSCFNVFAGLGVLIEDCDTMDRFGSNPPNSVFTYRGSSIFVRLE